MSQSGWTEDPTAFEDLPLVQEAIDNDMAAPGLDAPQREPDRDTVSFQEPGQPPITFWR